MTLAQDFAKTLTDVHYNTGKYLTFNKRDVESFLSAQDRSTSGASSVIAELVRNNEAVMVKPAKNGKGGHPAEYQLLAIAKMEANMPVTVEPETYQNMMDKVTDVDEAIDVINIAVDDFEGSNPDDRLKMVHLDEETNRVIIKTARDTLKDLIYSRFGNPDGDPHKADRKRIQNDMERQRTDKANMMAMLNRMAGDTALKGVSPVLRALVLGQTQADDNTSSMHDLLVGTVETLAVSLDDILEIVVNLMEQMTQNQDILTNNQRELASRLNEQNGAQATLLKKNMQLVAGWEERVKVLEAINDPEPPHSKQQLIDEYKFGYRDGYNDGFKTGTEDYE